MRSGGLASGHAILRDGFTTQPDAEKYAQGVRQVAIEFAVAVAGAAKELFAKAGEDMKLADVVANAAPVTRITGVIRTAF